MSELWAAVHTNWKRENIIRYTILRYAISCAKTIRNMLVNHFVSLVPFYIPWNLWFSDVVRGYRKRPMARDGLNTVYNDGKQRITLYFTLYLYRLVRIPHRCGVLTSFSRWLFSKKNYLRGLTGFRAGLWKFLQNA